MGYRLGIDIGGTFTDAMLIDEDTGEVWIDKVPSTPKDPSIGFMQSTDRILRKADAVATDITYAVHATTVATNAVIEGKTARTGFITTEGFRDMLEIARQTRPALYDPLFEKTPPLVPRHLCFEVPERLDAGGNVLIPLDEDAVRQVASRLREEGVESIAVCLLHAYVNPAHEERVGEILHEVFPEAPVSLSSRVAPEFREYFRASTTVINSCIQPVVARYLRRIESRLREEDVSGELLVMQSNGGVLTFSAAREKPVFMVESGPAAGVIAAAHIGENLGYRDIISFDMGGTTVKVGLIRDGKPSVTKEFEVGAAATAGVGSVRGSGYPIRTPVIDLVEIGAGGGSIAWVDSGGVLRVGPKSAGADPGPVCYPAGGTEPTVTDANLVLGRLNPEYFLGGEIGLDIEGAWQAIGEKCADPLGMDVPTVANGIVEIANAAMVNALRLVSVQRGYDPRDFVMVGFGGAGPVHANRLAAEMEIPRTIVPISPGVASSLGLLATDLKHDYSVTMVRQIEQLDVDEIDAVYRNLEDEGRTALTREGIHPDETVFLRQVEMRYVGQSYELAVPLSAGRLTPDDIPRVLAYFHEEHDRVYGYSAPEEPAEFVNLRLTAVGRIEKPRLRELDTDGDDASSARKENRQVYFSEEGGYVDCAIYDRYRLGAGVSIEGPAVIEEVDSTTVVHPGYQAIVDRWGNLLISQIV